MGLLSRIIKRQTNRVVNRVVDSAVDAAVAKGINSAKQAMANHSAEKNTAQDNSIETDNNQ